MSFVPRNWLKNRQISTKNKILGTFNTVHAVQKKKAHKSQIESYGNLLYTHF